ncbi:MAG TPA: RHS repeat-associated core domain-containing protein, partial [Conexivisphaerales archaeon]|nr:RHS repeat-associated core domain-containing protein [Conexivisphaerales archaeon]
NVFYERNMTTGAVTDHFYLGRLQLAKLSSSSSYYYHFDALGSIRLVTNAGAINAFSTNYLPYGIEYNTTGMETFLYTDKPVDASTGLYYFGARFYDASLFRFVSKDTNLGSTDDPLSLNLYAYSRDNPQRYVDSNGHSTVLSTTLMRTDSFNPLKKMDPLAYFLDWCQRHVLNLLEGLLLITLTILGPLYLMEFGPNVGAFVIMIVMPAAWGWGNLAYDMQKNDIGAAMFDVLSMAFALYDAWKVLVNPVTLWLLNLASAAMDVATEGILLAIRMPLVASAVAAFIAWIGADYAYEYSCYLAE